MSFNVVFKTVRQSLYSPYLSIEKISPTIVNSEYKRICEINVTTV